MLLKLFFEGRGYYWRRKKKSNAEFSRQEKYLEGGFFSCAIHRAAVTAISFNNNLLAFRWRETVLIVKAERGFFIMLRRIGEGVLECCCCFGHRALNLTISCAQIMEHLRRPPCIYF